MPKQTFYRLREEKQESVMRAAVHAFVEHGFTRAKISDIAKDAGIAKGSIFQYFEDKRELFIYTAQWGLELFMKKIDSQMNFGDMDIYEYLHDPSPITQVLMEENEVARFLEVAINEPGLIDDTMKSMYEVGNVYTIQLIQNGKKKGTVRNDLDDEILLDYFLSVTDRFSKRWLRSYFDVSTGAITNEEALKKEHAQMLELLRNGMGC